MPTLYFARPPQPQGESLTGYSARVVGKIENQKGWSYQRVGVFRRNADGEEQVGEYVRNYPTLYGTFFPFSIDQQDLALYSPQYTATRLMKLPSCEDIGGEEPSGGGFCPVEFFVPSYVERVYSTSDHQKEVTRTFSPDAETIDWFQREATYTSTRLSTGERIVHHSPPQQPVLRFLSFGLVAGCHWGDDSSWKVQYLDLSRVAQGVITRDDRFGYIELPDGMSLSEAVDMSDYRDQAPVVVMPVRASFNVRTGYVERRG